ncbi:kinase-like domain-containing protein, partial [Mycena maculata]
GWVASVISPLSTFIDMPINPRNHYLDLQEIADGPGGTMLYVARLADGNRDNLTLPIQVKERDRDDLLARRPTFVAIKSIPIMPTGSSKLGEVLRELRTMRNIRSDHILAMDALYVDPIEDTLWVRMELMTRTLSSVIELNEAGLVLSDRTIAGCTKDILTALEHLRVNGIAPRNIRSDNVLINKEGVLKLSMSCICARRQYFVNRTSIANLSNATKLSEESRGIPNVQISACWSNITSDASALGALVWEMAAGRRPPVNAQRRIEDWPPLSSIASRTPAFHEFIRICFDPAIKESGYRRLLESTFIRDACERPSLAQLLVQCTAFEGRLREQGRRN